MSALRLINETEMLLLVSIFQQQMSFSADFDIYKIVLSDTVSDTNRW